MTRQRIRWIGITVDIHLFTVACTGIAETPTKAYLGGTTRFAYRTETGASRAEITTTEIEPLEDGGYRVTTTTEEFTNSDDVRLAFFGGVAQWLSSSMSEGADPLFDLSPLGALSSQVLEPDRTYILPDGNKLQTGDRVTIAGLSGVEAVYTQHDLSEATIHVVLADDLYIRQFLPFPLRVEVAYEEDGTLGRRLAGRIELLEYISIPAEEAGS